MLEKEVAELKEENAKLRAQIDNLQARIDARQERPIDALARGGMRATEEAEA